MRHGRARENACCFQQAEQSIRLLRLLAHGSVQTSPTCLGPSITKTKEADERHRSSGG